MHIAICDDDNSITTQLEAVLHRYFENRMLKCPEIFIFHDGASLLSNPCKKEIVFLDVEMPGINGIEAGKALKEANEHVLIFILTSYMEYLDDAMRFQVFRYLSKPIDEYRLFRNLDDALDVIQNASSVIALETKDGMVSVPLEDIVFVESQGRTTIIQLRKKSYVSQKTMLEWSGLLSADCFFQTHRSFIVNLNHVFGFDHDTIQLCSGTYQACLTRRKYTEFKNRYLLFLETRR